MIDPLFPRSGTDTNHEIFERLARDFIFLPTPNISRLLILPNVFSTLFRSPFLSSFHPVVSSVSSDFFYLRLGSKYDKAS